MSCLYFLLLYIRSQYLKSLFMLKILFLCCVKLCSVYSMCYCKLIELEIYNYYFIIQARIRSLTAPEQSVCSHTQTLYMIVNTQCCAGCALVTMAPTNQGSAMVTSTSTPGSILIEVWRQLRSRTGKSHDFVHCCISQRMFPSVFIIIYM